MQIVYIPSESMSVQGKKDEIYKRYGKDWNIREQGGGLYLNTTVNPS